MGYDDNPNAAGAQAVLTTITDSYGREVTIAYDSRNRIQLITDPAGRKYELLYNPVWDEMTEVRFEDESGALLDKWKFDYSGVPLHGLLTAIKTSKWNDAGLIVEFKVMLRPLKAINLIHQKMAAMLQAVK